VVRRHQRHDCENRPAVKLKLIDGIRDELLILFLPGPPLA
jgi:hypothetical protein